ncbi:MAG: hypothetical protein ABS935_06480 [Solibacillus sp.]|uniref:hypothetical protein n=1 Tax=Solibacillus sp. TaxID=1909654 RepID=UPI0033152894
MLTKVERLREKGEYSRLNVENCDAKEELLPYDVERIDHKGETPLYIKKKHSIFFYRK